MSVKSIFTVVLSTAVTIGFMGLGITDAVNRKDKVDFQQVQLKSRSAEIKALNVKYDELNTELDKTSEKDKVEKEEVERLQREKEELDQQKKELEAQLQAKLESKSRLAVASDTVVNTATATQTASAAPVPSGGSLEAIVRNAAIKHGLDPDWFWNLAECESTWNPNAVNYNYYENGHPSGLFQHISGYWPARAAQHGYPGASVFDAEANANVTAAMWRSGSHLWACQ